MANERYEGVGPNGHYTLAERIFTKIKSLFDTKVKTDVPANAVFTDTLPTAYCTSNADATTKVAQCTNFSLKNNSYIPINFINGNTVEAFTEVTLNINNTGAKPLYVDWVFEGGQRTSQPFNASTYIIYYTNNAYYLYTNGTLFPYKNTPNISDIRYYTVSSEDNSVEVVEEQGPGLLGHPENWSVNLSVPLATTVSNGLLSAADKIKIDNFEDTKVTQTESTDNENYEVLISGTASTATTTEGVNKNTGFRYNPSLRAVMEGYNTTVSGVNTHAEGYGTKALEANAHAEGAYTSAVGANSHTEGHNTYAAGDSSHAEGLCNSAYGVGTHAEGYYSLATSATSYGGHVEGYRTTINGGSGIHAEGYQTYAQGDGSHAEGYQSYAKGTASHAEGYKTTALYEGHAEGQESYAPGNYSHAEGYKTTAGGEGAHAEGGYTQANQRYTHAEGYGTTANYAYAHAEGLYNYVGGSSGAHAEGNYTTANGNSSHAEGTYTLTNALDAHAEGYYSRATGDSAHAENNHTCASGNYSHTEGSYTTATHRSQHVFGEYNDLDASTATSSNRGNYVEIVGNGLSSTQLSNARTLDWDGNEKIAGNHYDVNGKLAHKPLTEDQYMALSQAEQEDGTEYFVTDRVPLQICDYIYPIGSIYMSVNNISPSVLFGGTWERIEDRFLLAAGSTYNVGATGGEAEHTLIEAELPTISGSWQIHAQENGTIFYIANGYATGTLKSGQYKTQTTATSGAYSQQSPGFKFGQNQSHNNMPPYLVVNVWMRVPDPVEEEEEEE